MSDEKAREIVVHHAVTGADYRERGSDGWRVTASTLPWRLSMQLAFTDPGVGKGAHVIQGREVRVYDSSGASDT